MTDLPRIETPRLILRVPVPKDAGAMARFALENKDHFAPWDPLRVDEYFTEGYWRKTLERVARDARDLTGVQFVILPRGVEPAPIIGQSALSEISLGSFQAAYLGYGLDHRHLGRGLMEEALRAVVRFCFEELKLHRIMANYMPTNVRSGRLLRKLGFVPEGYARDYLLLAGEWQDHVLTALTNDKWV